MRFACPFSKALLSLALVLASSAVLCHAATVDIHPGQDIPSIVAQNPAGTTFVIYPGTYRLTEGIVPKNGDQFIGQTACAPPKTSCPAIIVGSRVIGQLAKFNGTNYEVTNQTQQGKAAVPIIGPAGKMQILCDTSWQGCIYPEDLFVDGVAYQHLKSATLPAIGSRQWWFDYATHVIYFHDNPAGHNVQTSVVPYAFGGPANNVTIRYLTVKGFASQYPNGTIGTYHGVNALTAGASWTVQNCEVTMNHGYGVRLGYRMKVLSSYLHYNGELGAGGGIGTPSKPITHSTNAGIIVQGNVITYNDFAHWNPDFGSGGLKIGSTLGVTVRGNTIQYNEGAGVHFDDQTGNVLLDHNVITDNTDSDGVTQEMGTGSAVFRNNTFLRNGRQANWNYFSEQIAVHASTNVNMYCNVLEVAKGAGLNGWNIGAAPRGYSAFPPYEYLATTGNYFHHNTVIWDAGAVGSAGFILTDAAHQPKFFANNMRPDHNDYHYAGSRPILQYDNNDSQLNARKTFPQYQSAGADAHGAFDGNYDKGFPKVVITAPLDQSSFASALSVKAAASDASGISRMELYIDWTLKQTVAGGSSTFDLNNMIGPLATGSHIITAMAYSNAGIRNCYAITVNKK